MISYIPPREQHSRTVDSGEQSKSKSLPQNQRFKQSTVTVQVPNPIVRRHQTHELHSVSAATTAGPIE